MKRTPLKRGTKRLKRTPLKRGTKQLKRTPLKRGNKRLKSKPYRRTAIQARYHNKHPICEVPKCRKGAMPTPHHVDGRLLRLDVFSNFFSLCWWHHIGPVSVHMLGIKRFCEKFNLTKHLKWVIVYSRVGWMGVDNG